jgi:hypothetical protein
MEREVTRGLIIRYSYWCSECAAEFTFDRLTRAVCSWCLTPLLPMASDDRTSSVQASRRAARHYEHDHGGSALDGETTAAALSMSLNR